MTQEVTKDSDFLLSGRTARASLANRINESVKWPVAKLRLATGCGLKRAIWGKVCREVSKDLKRVNSSTLNSIQYLDIQELVSIPNLVKKFETTGKPNLESVVVIITEASIRIRM